MVEQGVFHHAHVLVVADDTNRLDELLQAAELIAPDAVQRLDWFAADTAVREAPSVLVLDMRGVAEAALDAGLPLFCAFTIPVVAAFDKSQIDRAAAALLRDGAQLLCEPTVIDLIAALLVAVDESRRAALNSGVRENEAARLARLNEEVARIAKVLQRLTNREIAPDSRPDIGLADRRQGFDAGPEPDEPVDPADIRRIIRARQMRAPFFGEGLFEDPAWEILLDLFAAHFEHTEVSVSSLCIAAAVPPTTALRWIGKLVEAGLLDRQPDPFDRRRAFVTLTPRAMQGMRRYITATREAGLAFA